MRTLVLLRGIPGSGKSTFIKNNNLEEYTISLDEIRMMINSKKMNPDGSYSINQENINHVFDIFNQLLEYRMMNGEFTIVDASHTKPSDFNKYKQLVKKYRYRIYCIDFSDVSFETILERNKKRGFRSLSLEALKKHQMYISSEIPSGITVLKPEEWKKVLLSPMDLSTYSRIHVIGDIHGCMTVLKEYLGEMQDDEYYIFTGDYVDRGIENMEVLTFLDSIKDKKNVLMLEGNHEKWIKHFANDEEVHSKEFVKNTAPQLMKMSKKQLRKICSRFAQCAYFKYNNKTFFVCHGGVPHLKENPAFIPTRDLVHGVGRYQDYELVADTWEEMQDEYLINGHRNTFKVPIPYSEHCFNLCEDIENGGNLRCLRVDSEGCHPVYTKNTVFAPTELRKLRQNEFVKEKRFGDISSFNFSREAFQKKIWNEQTIQARGLYLNNKTGEVVARGYQKFFHADERRSELIYPVDIYEKENGFLGLASVHNNELFLTTKSDPIGDMAQLFKDLVKDKEKMFDYLKDKNQTLLFEVIHKDDPHIIRYNESKIVLLDVVENKLEMKKLPYDELCEVAKELNVEVKKKAVTVNNKEELIEWYRSVEHEHIEGYVLEDATGYMSKVKLPFYNYWKNVRGMMERIIVQGKKFEKTGDKDVDEFLKWVENNKDKIDKREKFLKVYEKYSK